MNPVIEQDQGNSDEAATISSHRNRQRQVNKVLEQVGPSGVVILENQLKELQGMGTINLSQNVISVTPAPTISISQLETSSEHYIFQAATNQDVTSMDGVANSIDITPSSKETRTVSSPANNKFQSVLVSFDRSYHPKPPDIEQALQSSHILTQTPTASYLCSQEGLYLTCCISTKSSLYFNKDQMNKALENCQIPGLKRQLQRSEWEVEDLKHSVDRALESIEDANLQKQMVLGQIETSCKLVLDSLQKVVNK